MTVNILGTEYTINKKKYDEEPAFERGSIDGYCDSFTHEIAYCDMDTYPGWENEQPSSKRICEQQTVRHEIIHAFLSESGLDSCTGRAEHGWAKNEEMVDWIAVQGPKIYAAWVAAGVA